MKFALENVKMSAKSATKDFTADFELGKVSVEYEVSETAQLIGFYKELNGTFKGLFEKYADRAMDLAEKRQVGLESKVCEQSNEISQLKTRNNELENRNHDMSEENTRLKKFNNEASDRVYDLEQTIKKMTDAGL